MKTKVVLGIVILVLLIGAGCEKEVPTAPKAAAQQPAAAPAEETGGQGAPPTTTEQKELSYTDRIRTEFLNNLNKIGSYSYQEYDVPRVYFVKGSNMKIELLTAVTTDGPRYDTVYLETSKRIAYAYCRDVTECKYSERKQYREIDYKDYQITTPVDFARGITKGELNELKTKQIKGAVMRLLNYTDANNNTVTVWMHNSYAFPYEIITETPDGKTSITKYTDVYFNVIKDSEVVPPEGTVLVE